jgi:hypothetical protein
MRAELVVFKQLVDGDLRKFEADSNDSPSGGGARDLRFRPYLRFDGAFEKLFPNQVSVSRRRSAGAEVTARKGMLFWTDRSSGTVRSREAQFEPPTDARPNEGRLVRVHEYDCFKSPYPSGEGELVLILALDASGRVWAQITSEHSLRTDDWHPDVASRILSCLAAKRPRNRVAQGYIDLASGGHFCNA